MKVFETFLLLLFLLCHGESSKILAIFQVSAYSHYQLGVKLLKPLAERGHHVTMIAPNKLDPPPKNWRNIYLDDFMKEIKQGDTKMIYEWAGAPSVLKIPVYNGFGYTITSECLKHSQTQELIHSNETFDLIVIEKFYNEALLGFAHKYKAPYIVMSTMGSSRWTNEIVGNPGSPAYVPDLFLDYNTKMNFWQRVCNTLYYIYAESYRHFYAFPKHQALMDEHFPGAKLEDLYYNASLIFLNSHVSIQAAVPRVPNMIDIGGFHVDPPKKLPQDLQSFLDESKEGVIFFSLGSNIQAKDMPDDTRNAILRTFSTIKQKVLWKWENDTLANQPPNLKLGKWFPQQDILAHPNIVLFITHCGLLSTIEAVHYGIPVLGIPLFAEQLMNAAVIEDSGYGLTVPFKDFTEEKFAALLYELLNNPKFRENVRSRSKILKDQQNTPLERAIFWTEYVLRHKGAPEHRSITLNLKWYQYLLLDVVAFLILISVLLSIAVVFCVKKVCFGKRPNIESSKKVN